jgi:sugar lactone lactonase YvrE
MGLVLALLLLTVVPGAAVGQEPPHDGRYFERQAALAYRAKDFAGYLTNLQKALELRPNHPRILYNLSGAYALNDKPVQAVDTLEQVAAMGLDYPAEKDTDIDSMKVSAAFQGVLMHFAENRKPIAPSRSAFTVKQTGLIAEGIAYDPTTKNFFISSVHQRKIIRIDAQGKASDLATASDGLWGVFGMKVDNVRRRLWVCTSAMPQMEGFDPANGANQAALLAFDLRGKEPVKRYPLPDRTQPHVFGDLVLAANGDVYVSDSGKPAIYVLREKAKELELFATNDRFVNLQGLALDSAGRKLYVADYSNGIFVVELSSKHVDLIAPAPKATMLGIDGIYWSNNSLIAIQNGVSPQRIVRLTFDRAGTGFASWQTIEANHPQHDDVTLGVLVGQELYYIANGQWNAIGDDGKFVHGVTLKEAVILRLPLNEKPKATAGPWPPGDGGNAGTHDTLIL